MQLRESSSTLVPEESIQRSQSVTSSIHSNKESPAQRLSKIETFGSVGNLDTIDSDDDDDIDGTFEKAKSVSILKHLVQTERMIFYKRDYFTV